MEEKTLDILQHELYELEEQLPEGGRIEYYRRKRFLEAALEQYVQHYLHGDECNEDRVKLLLKQKSLTYKFIFIALVVAVISWVFELEIELCLLLTTLLLGYFGRTYMDIKVDDLGLVNEYVLHEFDKKRIERDLASFGVDAESLKKYQWDWYVETGKNVTYDGYDPNSVSLGETYMNQGILEKLYKE
jgi:hypothetical protein